MGKQKEQYFFFDNRYCLEVGLRGGLKVVSYASNKQGNALKVQGRIDNNNKFVSLVRFKGGLSDNYRLSDIVAYCKGDLIELTPLSEDELNLIFKTTKPTFKEFTNDEILSLPIEKDNFDNTVYVEYLEDYERRFKLVKHFNKSNGFLTQHFIVTVKSVIDDYYTQYISNWSEDENTILITHVSSISDEHLESIFNTINDERVKRKLDQFHKDFRMTYSNTTNTNYQIQQEELIGSGSWYGL